MSEYRLIVSNSYGESIDLWHDKEVALTSLSGVSPEADVNTQNLSGSDGSSFVSSRMPERTISMVIQYRIEAEDAELTKLRVYSLFRIKEKVTFRYISPNQDKYITGYVSKCDTPPTEFPMITQVVIKAPDPYWHSSDVHNTWLCGVSSSFEFIKNNTVFNKVEFSAAKESSLTKIIYDGDMETGLTVTFRILTPVTMVGFKNANHNQTFKVSADFKTGDILTVCTIKRNKAVILERNTEKIDYLVRIVPGSQFPTLYPGENIFEVLVDGGGVSSINVTASYEALSGGI